MAELAADDFNRADSSSLGSDWTVVTATGFSIFSNFVYPTNTDNDTYAYFDSITWPNNQYAQVEIREPSSSNAGAGMGVILRCDGSANNLYRIVVNDNSYVAVGKIVSGSFTEIASRTQAFSANDVLKAEIEGTTIRVYRNGVQMGADITDAALSAGSAGLAYSSFASSPKIDAFSGGSIGATAVDATIVMTGIRATGVGGVVAPPRPRPAHPYSEINLRM